MIDLFVGLGVGPTTALLSVRGWMVRGTLHHPTQVLHFVVAVARACRSHYPLLLSGVSGVGSVVSVVEGLVSRSLGEGVLTRGFVM